MRLKTNLKQFLFKKYTPGKSRIISFLLFLVVLHLKAQQFDPYIESKVNALSYDSLYKQLLDFENLGIKQLGTEALDNTAEWIITQYETWGYPDIEVDSFHIGPNQVYNIIVTKTGTAYPDAYLIVDGHYDTYNGPGVNDNGSGTAIVLEVARSMADVETAYSIKFIHFTAEEVGLLGSQHYVDSIVIPQQLDIRLVFNIDEVGGVAGEVNNIITCERDEWAPNSNNEASAAFTDTLAALTEMYSELSTQISFAYGSDYVPFMLNGYVVTGFYETNESPYPHTINDSLTRLDPEYVFQVLKASLSATLYFANYIGTTSVAKQNPDNTPVFKLSPNPFGHCFRMDNPLDENILLEIFDMTGRLVFTDYLKSSSATIIEPGLQPGIYLYHLKVVKGNRIIQTDKIIKK